MKREFIALAIVLLISGGCNGNKQQSEDFLVVDVTANYPKKELILQDFMDVEYIPLETSDEFLTSANIQAIGRDIIILKNMNNDGDIFVFDRRGKGLRKINRLGQGGEEYTNVLGVTLDEGNEEIFINNHYSHKIKVYNLSGDFKRSYEQRETFFYDQIGDFDEKHLICHDGHLEFYKADLKRNFFLIVSKQDGEIKKEVAIPYEEKKSTLIVARDANGKVINDRNIYNRQLIPFQDNWILVEPSADTIYRYSQAHILKPFIVRTPSVNSMEPEVFLFPGVLTDRYYFMQAVKREYNFSTDTGMPRTDLVYDTQENAIFECIVYNDDFETKKLMSLAYEIPMFTIVNNEIAFMKRLEAYELVEAYKKGQLKGRLKEIASGLHEESNPVIMIAKYKK